ncbi:CocE/NonD family hydrolase [Sodalis ligni]|uniref:Xaa-Pro dipeptidyl-peptidase C-terminal domain-containing protein n=1 Tax=Sodalis ligni TaxID=2697027 RepID=A0A4R1NLZ7_9GAMM|nr:CocE/NonD family hydrolase [Sodalis ligni]TCL07011.1 hypothetical protein EZJ58_5314 [Sodalis ligni]
MTIMTRLAGRLWRLPPAENAVRVERDIAVTARDGVALMTDVYHPFGIDRPPIVLLRSPYGRKNIVGLCARLFAERGYTAVVQSVRGTFGSGGRFHPFFQERDDGLDAVGWIERQPWYGGRLGLWGASYMGQVHWAMAAELGERVAAIAIVRSTSDFAAAIWGGDGLRLEDFLSWICLVEAQEKSNAIVQALRRRFFGDAHARHYAALPLETLDEQVSGAAIDCWREWMAHDHPADPFWQPIRDRCTLARVTAPVSMVAGWSDLFIGHQLHDYAELQACGKTVRLTVDPWTHTSLKSLAGAMADAFDWFDIHLKGRESGKDALNHVKLWVVGANEWRNETAWPPAGSVSRALQLTGSGGLGEGGIAEAERRFVYDPKDPTPSLAGPTLSDASGRGDMRPLAARADVLSFIGPVLDQDTEIAGRPVLTINVSADGPEHDLFICLCDVDENGRATNITDGYQRLPGFAADTRRTVTLPLLPAYWRVAAGHRLQLLIAGGAFPRYARNLGLGERMSMATRSRKTTIAVHCGGKDPSRLALPLKGA